MQFKVNSHAGTPYVYFEFKGMCFRAFGAANGGYAVFRGDYMLGHAATIVDVLDLIALKFCSSGFRSGIDYAKSGSFPIDTLSGDHRAGFLANCRAWQIDERLFELWDKLGLYFVAC